MFLSDNATSSGYLFFYYIDKIYLNFRRVSKLGTIA